MKKKAYIEPKLEVVKLKLGSVLLAGSGVDGTDVFGDDHPADGGYETL